MQTRRGKRPLLGLAALFFFGCGNPPGDPPPPLASQIAPTTSALALVSASAPPPSSPLPPRSITMSAVGDCTLGHGLENGGDISLFDRVIESHGGDLAYPFSGVASLLAADDLSIANLEGTLTNSRQPIPQGKFHFRAKPEYARVLVAGSIEVANVANNHTGDFGARGYDDTLKALRDAAVGACGNGLADIREVRGVFVVNLGFVGLYATAENVRRDIKLYKKRENLVIASFHWGVEGSHYVIDTQRALGRAAIDAGADLVLGTHPHVVQGMETYRDRHIVYSLGNFIFGANTNPPELDSMIYRETFQERAGQMVPSASEVIPVRLCSELPCKEFRPVPLLGERREAFLRWFARENERLAKRPNPHAL